MPLKGILTGYLGLNIYFNDINNDREEKSAYYGKEVQDQINLLFESLELSSTGYTHFVEISSKDINFDNCQIKNLLTK